MKCSYHQNRQKKHYIAPKLVLKGDMAELTQATKTFGAGDGIVLVIPNNPGPPIPLANYS